MNPVTRKWCGKAGEEVTPTVGSEPTTASATESTTAAATAAATTAATVTELTTTTAGEVTSTTIGFDSFNGLVGGFCPPGVPGCGGAQFPLSPPFSSQDDEKEVTLPEGGSPLVEEEPHNHEQDSISTPEDEIPGE